MLTVEEPPAKILAKEFGDALQSLTTPIPRRVVVETQPVNQHRIAEFLLEKYDYVWLSTITGTDMGSSIELDYHIAVRDNLVTTKTAVPIETPCINTLTDIMPGAGVYEREVHDLLGVDFTGNNDLRRLLLPESWPSNSYPLRKKWNPDDLTTASTEACPIPQTAEGASNTVEKFIRIVVGPQHPALHEPERFLFKVDGEVVIDVESRIGYVHRGIEKAAERMSYLQDVHLIERICGICNVAHTSCFCSAVETIAKVELPPRAKYLRTIVAELNRIHSHLLLLGVAGYELGFQTLFQYTWRDREQVLDLMEMITGNRIMSEYNAFGGVRRDLSPTSIETCKQTLRKLASQMEFYQDFFRTDTTFRMRTHKVGVLSKKDVLSLGLVGPVARASGIPIDLRVNDPCSAHTDIPFNVVVHHDGDSLARFQVRADETVESINLILNALDNLPKGSFRVRVPRRIPAGEDVARIEAPRGELIHHVRSNGSDKPERVKVRSPTLANLNAFQPVVKGRYIADIPAILISLDPCFSCTDRLGFIDMNSNKKWVCSAHDLAHQTNRRE